MKTKRRCKTCLHWDRPRAEDAAGRVRSNRVARCRWWLAAPVADLPIPTWLHDAIIQWTALRWHATKATDGTNCPVWRGRAPNGPA